MPNEFEALPWLHIYGQYTYHGEAVIRGTKEGLTALRDAIDAALKRRPRDAHVFASDGEGYPVSVMMVNTQHTLGTPEYIFEAEYALSKAKAERDRQFRLQHKRAAK
jgi:hypothetical protein